jgi:DNA-directed RNA polymerase subunit RPC12/RpoP
VTRHADPARCSGGHDHRNAPRHGYGLTPQERARIGCWKCTHLVLVHPRSPAEKREHCLGRPEQGHACELAQAAGKRQDGPPAPGRLVAAFSRNQPRRAGWMRATRVPDVRESGRLAAESQTAASEVRGSRSPDCARSRFAQTMRGARGDWRIPSWQCGSTERRRGPGHGRSHSGRAALWADCSVGCRPEQRRQPRQRTLLHPAGKAGA